MLELLKSLVFAVIMVPVVLAIILGLIYGLGEVFNIFPVSVKKDRVRRRAADFPKRPLSRAFLFLRSCFFLPIFSVFNR